MQLDAFHLPGIDEAGIRGWETREYGGGAVTLRLPVLEPETIRLLAGRVRAAALNHLAETPVAEIVHAVDRAAALLQRRDHPVRAAAEEALPAVTGYSPEMIRLILDRMAADWRAPALDELLRREFGDPGVLDGFQVVEGGEAGENEAERVPVRVRAYGPELAYHIFAGNIPGVAVTSIVRSLLVKGATLGKTASGDPLLPALFAQLIARVAPELGECLAIAYWPGSARELQEAALREAEVVVVYGGEEAVRSVRDIIPTGVRLVEHGPRFSLAGIAREVLERGSAGEAARGVAGAVAVFDQQGCVSPHVVYVERGGKVAPEEFAELVARELEGLEEVLPRGELGLEEAAAIQQLRGAAEFRTFAGRETRLFASEGTEFTVIYEAEAAFAPSPLNRVIRIVPVDDLSEIAGHLGPYRRYLQTVGLAAGEKRLPELAELFGRAGASRITTLEEMPWPPPTWHHDGQEPLRELVRWVDWEGRDSGLGVRDSGMR